MKPTIIWKSIERGSENERTLVLLHGIGMSSMAWSPVLDRLGAKRRVIAFDLPGFGKTPALLQDVAPPPKRMAEDLARVLQAKGIPLPVDIAGNSLGGYVALEFAKLGFARSVVGISPAGLWRGTMPPWVRLHLRLIHWTVSHALRLRLAKLIVRCRATRAIFLAVPVSPKGWRIPTNEVIQMLDTFAKATHLEAVAQAASEPFRDGKNISVPCTIAFGDKDWLLRKRESQYRDELPLGYCWLILPGCGHVPMWDNPKAVTKLILDRTA